MWPLWLSAIWTHGSLAGWGAGSLATAGWLLLAGVSTQLWLGHRGRRAVPVPGPVAAELLALAAAMAQLGGSDWSVLELHAENGVNRLTVYRAGGERAVLTPWSPALLARWDQFSAAFPTAVAPGVLVRVARDGTVRAFRL